MRSVGGFRASPVLLLALLACGDDPAAPPLPVPTSISIAPSTVTLWRGVSFHLTATVRDQNARPMSAVAVTWRSGDPSTATVDATGLVTAVGSGETTVTATAGAASGTAVVNVDNQATDRVVLTALYETTNGTGWTNASNWLSDAPLADWHGVEVDDAGRVTKLHLGENDLEGPIPTVIGHLPTLTELYLHENALTGSIPPIIGQLSELRVLELGSNDLTGPIPPELGDLAALTRLRLEHNGLTRSIPPELGRLSKLDTLSLWNNDLTGSIPPELGTSVPV